MYMAEYYNVTLKHYVVHVYACVEGALRSLLDQWKEYRMLLNFTSFGGFSYQAPVAHTGRRSRPKFDIDKEQIEYLAFYHFHSIGLT